MPVRIKIAETPTELEDLFVARHKVFVEEEGYLASRKNSRIVDQFDAFPTTVNIIALMDNQVVGGIRITACSSSGLPSDHFFNFSPFFQDAPDSVAGVSQFFLRKNRRANRYRIGILLMGMCAYWAKRQNFTHLVAAVNPVISPLLKFVGMETVAAQFFHHDEGVHVLPMVLDMIQIKEPIASIVKRQMAHNYNENFDREYYLAGERIEDTHHAVPGHLMVMDGKVTVHEQPSPQSRLQKKALMEIGPGQSLKGFDRFSTLPDELQLWAGEKTEVMRTKREFPNSLLPDGLDYYSGNAPSENDSSTGTTVH